MSKSPKLLCYDIRCPKRLKKVHQIVSTTMMAIQYSVFFAELNAADVSNILQKLSKVIDKDADDVRVYSVRELKREQHLGNGPPAQGIFVYFPSGFSL